MSIAREPKPAKLVISMFMQDKERFQEVTRSLSESLGLVDMVSPWLPFKKTDYYTAEMGAPLFRRLMAYSELMEQEGLADVKLVTNELEEKFAKRGNDGSISTRDTSWLSGLFWLRGKTMPTVFT